MMKNTPRHIATRFSRYHLDSRQTEIREPHGYYLRDADGNYYEPAFGVRRVAGDLGLIAVWSRDNRLLHIDPGRLTATTLEGRVWRRLARLWRVDTWASLWRRLVRAALFAFWLD